MLIGPSQTKLQVCLLASTCISLEKDVFVGPQRMYDILPCRALKTACHLASISKESQASHLLFTLLLNQVFDY